MYGGQTPRFRAPYLTYGDVLTETDSKRQAYIFEGQLYGAIKSHSGGHGVIREGQYTFDSEDGGTFRVTVSKIDLSNTPALEAFINQVAVYEEGSFYWGGLEDNNTYYLFVRLVETMDETSVQAGEFIAEASLDSSIPDDGILLATVTITSGVGVIDLDPAGKDRIPRLDEHIADNTDPHGSTWYQTQLFCSGIQVAESGIFLGAVLYHGNEEHLGPQTFKGPVDFQGPVSFQSSVHFQSTILIDSGIPIDGVDVSTLQKFFDGSYVGTDHIHTPGFAPVEKITLSPFYPNSFLSGITIAGVLAGAQPVFFEGQNAIKVQRPLMTPSGSLFTRVILRIMVPDDFLSWSGVQFSNKIYNEFGVPNPYVGIRIHDTLGNSVKDVRPLRNLSWTSTPITLPTGTFTPGEFFNVYIDLYTFSNALFLSAAYAGDLVLHYNPAN